MFAFERQKHESKREVLIEKKGHFHELEDYFIEDYDTVELVLTNGEKLAEGVLQGYGGYRGGYNEKTLGYFSVTLFIGTRYEEFTDFKYMRRRGTNEKQEIFLRLYPCRCVLIEKNIVTKYEDMMKTIREEWNKNPIFGG
jgi:hypothetical protein